MLKGIIIMGHSVMGLWHLVAVALSRCVLITSSIARKGCALLVPVEPTLAICFERRMWIRSFLSMVHGMVTDTCAVARVLVSGHQLRFTATLQLP